MQLFYHFAVSLSLCCAALEVGSSPDFDHLRSSVVRIQAVSSQFDWFHPFSAGEDGVGLGSGFVVQTKPYPMFVTNEHVINDAKQVTLQLLLYGEQQWEAEVVSVCPKFDLAVLVLKEPAAFEAAMAEQGIQIQALPISDRTTAMGEDVVALGFPLGQDSLKISKGNVAGNEEVDGNICIQSTAPISPGSSGGPLLNEDGSEVVGVNFAKATEGENINYVIPAWRVKQMIRRHLNDQPTAPADGAWQRLQVHVPRADITIVEANEALYEMTGCSRGTYISKIGQRSFLLRADPPVQEHSFLVSVRSRELDAFGMGVNPEYAADRVHFEDLLFMAPDLTSSIDIETCFEGKVHRHMATIAYDPSYDRGISFVDEPFMSGWSKTYEVFGDISVMQMTVNHVSAILSQWGDSSPTRWLHPDEVAQPRLIVASVRSGGYAGQVLSAGAAVESVNGHAVRTLEEFRLHLAPDAGDVWTLETDMGKVLALPFSQSLSEQVSLASANNLPYLLTPGVVSAASKLGFTVPGASLEVVAAVAASKPATESKMVAVAPKQTRGWRTLQAGQAKTAAPVNRSSDSALKFALKKALRQAAPRNASVLAHNHTEDFEARLDRATSMMRSSNSALKLALKKDAKRMKVAEARFESTVSAVKAEHSIRRFDTPAFNRTGYRHLALISKELQTRAAGPLAVSKAGRGVSRTSRSGRPARLDF